MYHPQQVTLNHPLPGLGHATLSIYCVLFLVFSLEFSGLLLMVLRPQPLPGALVVTLGITLAQTSINFFYFWSVWISRGRWREGWRRELIRQLFSIVCFLVDLLAIAASWAILALTITTGLSLQVHALLIASIRWTS